MADIEFRIEKHVAHVRLNRPAALNSITPEMDDLLLSAWTEINADPNIWAVILSAEGEKSFCIGADVSGGAERRPLHAVVSCRVAPHRQISAARRDRRIGQRAHQRPPSALEGI